MNNIGDVLFAAASLSLRSRTQREREQQQAEAAEIQRRLLVELGRRVERHGEQQHRSGETGTTQERQQHRAQHEVGGVRDARPHGRQAQTCSHKGNIIDHVEHLILTVDTVGTIFSKTGMLMSKHTTL